jgi:hypothetical protein
MAVKPLTPVINSWPPLPGAPPALIKGRGAPPVITAPHLALNHSLPSPQLLLTGRRRLPILHHCRPASTAPPSSGETRAEFPSLPSLFCTPASELWHTGADGGQAPVSAPPCPLSAPASVHGGPSTPGRSTDLSVEKHFVIRIIRKFCKEVPGLL